MPSLPVRRRNLSCLWVYPRIVKMGLTRRPAARHAFDDASLACRLPVQGVKQSRCAEMIIWKNRRIEDLAVGELRLALEEAADEIIKAQRTFGSDQVWTTLFAGFLAGAVVSALALSGLHHLV